MRSVLQSRPNGRSEIKGLQTPANYSTQHGRNMANRDLFFGNVPMSITEKAIEFLQKGEKLIILTLTVTIAGVVCFLAEQSSVVSFEGLPTWARPVAEIVWVLSTVHVCIHAAIGLYCGAVWLAVRLKGLPERRRKACYNAAIVDRLLEVGPLGREMLCYAFYSAPTISGSMMTTVHAIG